MWRCCLTCTNAGVTLHSGKSAAISVSALVLGTIMGNIIESWLRVDIVPVLGVSSPGVVVGEFTILSLYTAAALLR